MVSIWSVTLTQSHLQLFVKASYHLLLSFVYLVVVLHRKFGDWIKCALSFFLSMSCQQNPHKHLVDWLCLMSKTCLGLLMLKGVLSNVNKNILDIASPIERDMVLD